MSALTLIKLSSGYSSAMEIQSYISILDSYVPGQNIQVPALYVQN